MNLYAAFMVNHAQTTADNNSNIVYVDGSFNVVTTINKDKTKLYVLKDKATFYLSDECVPHEGIAHVLLSSANLKRILGYADALLRTNQLNLNS
jgi:hypothetical protein